MAKKITKVSIEGLARMIQRGFDATATKGELGNLEKKVDAIDIRFKTVETKIDKLPTRSEMVDNATLKK